MGHVTLCGCLAIQEEVVEMFDSEVVTLILFQCIRPRAKVAVKSLWSGLQGRRRPSVYTVLLGLRHLQTAVGFQRFSNLVINF